MPSRRNKHVPKAAPQDARRDAGDRDKGKGRDKGRDEPEGRAIQGQNGGFKVEICKSWRDRRSCRRGCYCPYLHCTPDMLPVGGCMLDPDDDVHATYNSWPGPYRLMWEQLQTKHILAQFPAAGPPPAETATVGEKVAYYGQLGFEPCAFTVPNVLKTFHREEANEVARRAREAHAL